MKENDKLTYMQQVALEGEVAFALSSAIHNADLKMRIYIILKELKEDYRGYVIQAVKNIVQLPEEELERVILEVSQPEMPLWLWVDRCIADIKLAVLGCILYQLLLHSQVHPRSRHYPVLLECCRLQPCRGADR